MLGTLYKCRGLRGIESATMWIDCRSAWDICGIKPTTTGFWGLKRRKIADRSPTRIHHHRPNACGKQGLNMKYIQRSVGLICASQAYKGHNLETTEFLSALDSLMRRLQAIQPHGLLTKKKEKKPVCVSYVHGET